MLTLLVASFADGGTQLPPTLLERSGIRARLCRNGSLVGLERANALSDGSALGRSKEEAVLAPDRAIIGSQTADLALKSTARGLHGPRRGTCTAQGGKLCPVALARRRLSRGRSSATDQDEDGQGVMSCGA
jgi:hypothetical protein